MVKTSQNTKEQPKKAEGAKPKANSAFMKPLRPSKDLAEVIGASPIPRSEVVSKIWAYIRTHKLQDAKNKRNINADSKLLPVFGGKKQVTMFELNKHLAAHLS